MLGNLRPCLIFREHTPGWPFQVPPRQEELSVVRDRVSISCREHRAKQPTGMTSHPSLEQPGMVVDACSPAYQEVETGGLP